MAPQFHFRKIQTSDYDFWSKELSVPDSLQHFEKLVSLLALEEEQKKSYSFILEVEGRPVGFFQVFDVLSVPERTGKIEISIAKSMQRHGYGKVCITFLEDFCFKQLDLKSLISIIRLENKASIALFESLGYEFKTTEGFWLKSSDQT